MTWWTEWWPRIISVSWRFWKRKKKSILIHFPMVIDRSDTRVWPFFSCTLGVVPPDHNQMLFVCTAHIHWDPEYCDVKIVQTLMLLSEVKTIMEDAIETYRSNTNRPLDCAAVPLVLCGDFNSLPDSGIHCSWSKNGRTVFSSQVWSNWFVMGQSLSIMLTSKISATNRIFRSIVESIRILHRTIQLYIISNSNQPMKTHLHRSCPIRTLRE